MREEEGGKQSKVTTTKPRRQMHAVVNRKEQVPGSRDSLPSFIMGPVAGHCSFLLSGLQQNGIILLYMPSF